MRSRRATVAAICLILLLLFTSCTAKNSSGSVMQSTKRAGASAAEKSVSSAQPLDLSKEAQKLDVSEGRAALALIICKLDSSKVVSELAQKDASDLLDILTETALQNSQSLESLDEQYDLKDILASEGVYITIKSNAVSESLAPSGSPGNGWVQNFQNAYNAAPSSTS